jgi:hypothetical protein
MHNPENERIKRGYFVYLKEARRLGEHSIDGAAAALAKFEDYTRFRDFKKFSHPAGDRVQEPACRTYQPAHG